MDRAGPGNVIIRETVVDDLIDAVSADMTNMLSDRLKAGRVPDAAAGRAKQPNQFELHVGVADMVFPEIVKNEKGEYTVTAGRYKLEQLAVTVELNGVVIGTTPGPFAAKPGLHKLRLRRAMFRDWEGTVNIADGQVLQIAMQMTPEGLQQFAAMTKFMQELKLNTILTDAQAKMWEGYAKQLEQSGFRVDKKVNINKSIQHDSKDLKEKPAEPQAPPAPPPAPSAPAPGPSRPTEELPPAPGGDVNRGDSKPPFPAELPGTPR